MNRSGFSVASFVALLVGLSAALYPSDKQLRRLAHHPGASEQARNELLTWLGDPPPAQEVTVLRRVAVLMNAAQSRFYRREWDDCVAVLREIVADPEALPEDVLRAVRFAIWMDRKAEAVRFCDSFTVYFGLPRDVGSLELMAHVYADGGQKIQAADVWAAIYRAETDEAFRRRALRSVAALDSTEVAIRLHEEQLARSPDDSDARLRLARLYQVHDMKAPYLSQLEELLRRDPGRDDLRTEMAWGCAAARQYDRLLPHLDALRQRGRETPELRELYLEALVETGKPEKDIGALTLAAERAFGERRRDRCLELIREAVAHPQASEAAVFRCVQLGLWLNSVSDAARSCDVLIARFGLPKDLERLKFVAQVYGDRGEKAKGAELWAMAYRLEPDEAGRRMDMQAAIALDPGPRAIDLSADYLSRNPDDHAVRETHARLLQAGGRMQPYLRELETILRRFPGRDDLRTDLVAACAATRDYERLIPHVEELRRRGRDSKELRDLYLTALDETGRLDELAGKRPIAELQARDAPLLRALVEFYEDRQSLEKAADLRTRLFDLGVGDKEDGPRAAATYELLGRWDDARRLYRALHERFPKEAEWSAKLAELHDLDYERAGVKAALANLDYYEAVRAGLDLLTHTPEDPVVLRQVADGLMAMSDFARAREHYLRLQRLAPDDYEAAYRIVACSEGMGDPAGARAGVAWALRLIDGQPTTPPNRLIKARLLILIDRLDEARAILIGLLREEMPADAEGLSAFAQALLDVGDEQIMDPVLKKWRDLEPRSPRLREFWATSLIRRGKLDEAYWLLRPQAGEKLPEALLGMYVEVLLDLGRWSDAQEALDRQEPGNPAYDWVRERIRTSYGPKANAEGSFYSAVLEEHLRLGEGYRTFVTEHTWVAESASFSSLHGRVLSLKSDEEVEVLRGGLTVGYHDGLSIQSFMTVGGWEGEGRARPWGAAGMDFFGGDWDLSLDLELNRPWDTIVEAAAFDGVEYRIAEGSSFSLGRFFLFESLRLSRYEIGDGRGLIAEGAAAEEAQVVGRLEYRFVTGRSLSPGFYDGSLRAERNPVSHIAIVGQVGYSEFDGPADLKRAIPVVRRSQPNEIGVSSDWTLSDGTMAGGEFLVGMDTPRGLDPGKLYGGTVRLAQDLGRDARLWLNATYSSEQFEIERGSSWLFQISLSTKF